MTNDDVLFMAQNLGLVDAPEMDADFNYAVADNLREAEKVAENIRKAVKPDNDYTAYETDMEKLRKEFANKDDKGDPKKTIVPVLGGTQIFYDIPDADNPESPFGKARDALKEKYKEAIDKHEKKMEFLKKENTQFKPMMVNRKLIPKGLKRRAMDAVYLMVEKDDKPAKKK